MAWIESHQSLLFHRKTLKVSEKLGISKYLLIGHLHAFWWWALDNAKDDGEIGDVSAQQIAEAAGFPKRRAAEFVAALVEAGFVDETGDGIRLHNWYRYAGKLNEKRAKDRARKSNSNGTPAELPRKSQAPTNQPNQPNQPISYGDTAPAGIHPDLDHADERGFALEYIRRYEQKNARPPSPNEKAAARALERDFGTDVCLRAASDHDWLRHPNWLREKLKNATPIIATRRSPGRGAGSEPDVTDAWKDYIERFDAENG